MGLRRKLRATAKSGDGTFRQHAKLQHRNTRKSHRYVNHFPHIHPAQFVPRSLPTEVETKILVPMAAGYDQFRSATTEHTPHRAVDVEEGAARQVHPNGGFACPEHIAHGTEPATLLVAPRCTLSTAMIPY
jgi:hypothetical protein